MRINHSHLRVLNRLQTGAGSTGTKGLTKTHSDLRGDNKSDSSEPGIRDLLSDQQAPSGGLPFNNPMDDADTLMRAILANHVEHKAETDASKLQSSKPPTGEDKALADITEQFQSQFKDNASNKEQFHSLMKKSFGESYDYTKAENIRQQTLNGDFSWMPEIKVVDAATLSDTSGQQGAGAGMGAYSKDNDTIYLNRDLLTSDPSKAVDTLTEEIGHSLDARLNTKDAAGDEGRIFADLSSGKEISDTELQELRSENDSGTIVVDGKEVEVEFFFKKAFKKIKKGIKKPCNG